MRLDIGGSYPAAPFNGWYMATEISARNLADSDRYDMLGEVAGAMGLYTSNDCTLWRDLVVIEFYGGGAALLRPGRGCRWPTITVKSAVVPGSVEKEEAAGAALPGGLELDRPADLGRLTPAFHRYYDEPTDTGPMFHLDDQAAARGQGCPSYRTAPTTTPPGSLRTREGPAPWAHPVIRAWPSRARQAGGAAVHYEPVRAGQRPARRGTAR